MKGRSASNEEVISLAACHTCAAMRKEPCRFNRTDDPEGIRAYRRQSHPDRVIRANKIFAEMYALPLDL